MTTEQIGLVLLGGVLLAGMFFFMRRKKDPEEARREEVLQKFRETHARVREKRKAGDGREDEPGPEAMEGSIDRWADEDGRKAADTVRRMMND